MRKNLFKIEKSYFWDSSYLWWLLVHQNLEKMMEARLQVQPATSSKGPTPIDLRFPILTKFHGSYYEFMDKLYAPMVEILTRKPTHRICQSTI